MATRRAWYHPRFFSHLHRQLHKLHFMVDGVEASLTDTTLLLDPALHRATMTGGVQLAMPWEPLAALFGLRAPKPAANQGQEAAAGAGDGKDKGTGQGKGAAASKATAAATTGRGASSSAAAPRPVTAAAAAAAARPVSKEIEEVVEDKPAEAVAVPTPEEVAAALLAKMGTQEDARAVLDDVDRLLVVWN
jgi:hypothetical protein